MLKGSLLKKWSTSNKGCGMFYFLRNKIKNTTCKNNKKTNNYTKKTPSFVRS
jgi:hypothetical protein